MRKGLLLLSFLLLAACGSESKPDTGVELSVFADWNGDGVQAMGEEGGILKVIAELGSVGTLETGKDGKALLEAPAATYSFRLTQTPASWRLTTPAVASVSIEAGKLASVVVGMRPEVSAGRIPYKLVLMGDSITSGYTQNADNSYSVDGYDNPIQDLLSKHFGRISIANRALAGTKSSCGVSMLESRLRGDAAGLLTCDCKRTDQSIGQPEDSTSQDVAPFGPGAYLLILYGTNDFNDPGNCLVQCKREPYECNTVQNLQTMALRAREAGMIPIVGTLVPGYKQCNATWNSRYNAAIEALNAEIRAMAEANGILLADYWKAFKSPRSPAITELISDTKLWITNEGTQRCGPGLHPTRKGYSLMAEVAYLELTGQPFPYADTPLGPTLPLSVALEDYQRFVMETGYQADSLPAIHTPQN